ncbi:hypothetical protein GQ42DRAFT_181934 [Ramicandelaber brevisporus]|nr:hypothetical protein GQ42DRAFT_181934 [Ramicandelaber brevisporus]
MDTTTTFRFTIDNSSNSSLSMTSTVARAATPHLHPPSNICDGLFLQGIGSGCAAVDSSSTYKAFLIDLGQQQQQPVQQSASSATVAIEAIVSKPRRRGRPRKSEQQQQQQNTPLPTVQSEQQQPNPSSTKKRDRDKLDAYSTQSLSQPKLLEAAINYIESHNLQATISTSEQEQQVHQQQQQQQQVQQVQQQHQHQHQNQQPHPSKPSVSIVTSLPPKGSDIAKPSFPQLPPPAFPISPSSSTQQQKQSPPSATVLNEVKSSQPRRQYQPPAKQIRGRTEGTLQSTV